MPELAERKGFEPSIPSPVYSLSRGAPSTTRPPLHAVGLSYSVRFATPSGRSWQRKISGSGVVGGLYGFEIPPGEPVRAVDLSPASAQAMLSP